MTKTRLLAIDLDGTLLTSGKQILPEVVDAVAEARAAAVEVVLASGRIAPSMRPFASELGLSDGPMICGNGTHVRISPESDLYSLHLPTDALAEIINYAQVTGVHLNIYTPDNVYFLRETPWGDVYRSRVESVIPQTLPEDWTKLKCLKALIVDEPAQMAQHCSSVLGCFPQPLVRAIESEPEYLEFMDHRATKGYALRHLAEHLGIPQSQTAAIGDYLNDIEMLEFVHLSGAVANAHPKTLSIAKVRVSCNESAGVSEFIRQFVLQQ